MNALTNPLAHVSDVLREEKALRDAPTLFNSRDVLRALDAKYGAAAQYAFVDSVWTDAQKVECDAEAEAALRGQPR
jgi:hypothetical protein